MKNICALSFFFICNHLIFPFTDNNQQANPLLLVAKTCSASTVEQMIKVHIERNLPLDECTYQAFPDEPALQSPGIKKRVSRSGVVYIKDTTFPLMYKNNASQMVYYCDSNLLHLLAFRTDWNSPEELAALERMVKILTKNGLDINQTNFAAETPLSMCKFDPKNPHLPEKQLERARILIDCGAKAQWWFGHDPLSQVHLAIKLLERKRAQQELIEKDHIELDKLKAYELFLRNYKPVQN
jgi:hypothetical protein